MGAVHDDLELRPHEGPWEGPIPIPDLDSGFYWDSIRAHRLQLLRCRRCGNWIHYPLAGCPRCHSMDVAPEPVSGRGTIYSFTRVEREFAPGIEPPFVIAVVDVAEQAGVRLVTNIVNCRFSEVRIGAEVRAVYHDVTEETTLLLFELDREQG